MSLNLNTDHAILWVKHHVKTNVLVGVLLTLSVKRYLLCLLHTDTVQVYFWIISLQAHTSMDHNSHLLCPLPTHCSITSRAASVQSVSETASTSRGRQTEGFCLQRITVNVNIGSCNNSILSIDHQSIMLQCCSQVGFLLLIFGCCYIIYFKTKNTTYIRI